MACRGCSADLDPGAAYCGVCGTRVVSDTGKRRLTRRPEDGKIAGVCEGLAAYFDTDPTLVRLAWIILSVVPGVIVGGAIAYLACWALIPREDAAPPPRDAAPRRLRRSEQDRRVAGVCGGVAEYFDLDATPVRLAWVVLTIWPGAIVFGTALYAVAWFIMPSEPERMASQDRSSARV